MNVSNVSNVSEETAGETAAPVPPPPISSMHAIHPDGWSKAVGYTNGVVVTGQQLYLSGQIGWNPATAVFDTDDFAEQVAQTLRNIVAILTTAGAAPRHIVRMTWYITDKAAYLAARREIGAAYREIIGRHFPTMSVVVVSALIEDRAKVEIETTALIPAADADGFHG